MNSTSNTTITTENSAMKEFILPDIGEGIVECELLAWLVEEGQTIIEDQPVAEVMTDKATVQIPAMYNGVINKLHYTTGDIAIVHQPLFSMLVTDNKAKATAKSLASPAVRRLAKESGIDINQITGTGTKGRVMKADLHAEGIANKVTRTASSPIETDVKVQDESSGHSVVMRGLQAGMAKQMSNAWDKIPHFTVSDECVVDHLLGLKHTLSPQFEQAGIKLTLLPFMVKALSLALTEFPIINASVSDDGTAIDYHSSHNIGIAIDTGNGLIVPNIKAVQRLSIYQIAQRIQELVDAAKHNKLTSDELSGGTITLSNIGPIGGITATPIINHPEIAIVALGKIQHLPRFDDTGNVVGLNIMNINWSGDHRVIDGATMVRFNNTWMQYLSQPVAMLTHLR